jgi:hypothetical protein
LSAELLEDEKERAIEAQSDLHTGKVIDEQEERSRTDHEQRSR